MIKIRYADLPAGLHVQAVASGKDTVVYLLPGLTAVQRQAALRRARSSARMGQGPRLPAAGVAAAVAVDRIRTTVRNAAAAMRAHPATFVPPIVIIVSAAVAYLLLVSVTIRSREPQASGLGGPGAPIAAAVAPPPSGGAAKNPRSQPAVPPVPGRSLGQSHKPAPRRSGGGGHHAAGTAPSPTPAPAPTPSPTAPVPGASPSPAPEESAPTTGPAPSPGGPNSPAAPGGPNWPAAPGGPNSTGPSSGAPVTDGLCLDAGLLGVCLSA